MGLSTALSTGLSTGLDTESEELVIRLDDVSKTYQHGSVPVRALSHVDLEIARGEYTAIMGPSGSGKSTLLHVLGLLDAGYEGRYELLGEPVSGRTAEELSALRNRQIGFIFQTFHLLPHLSILENAELPALYAGNRPARECRAAARARLEQMGLGSRLNHKPQEISIGQRQRAAIARALVNDPPLLLADEPTGALDSKTVAEILDILGELHSNGTTILLITHDRDVSEATERTVHVRDGQMHDGRLSDEPRAPLRETRRP
ncbi:MAG: ABC transporter ATP-binding protein [Deltaproteobacteria bacterium]|nr:ABC transporter ATP-binding protein [Deltaproteobacteria bacterium]MBW2416904.1 ABC transporter ATP-binding protein [Deltaproteobacteria bacterium]